MDLKELLGVKSVITMYGMTEAGPGITSSSPEDSLDVVVSSAGRLWPGVQARIRDLDTGEEAAPGTAGEICVKSPSIMKEYYKDPEETRKAIDENGWLHTGDVGLLNEEGLLILKGRCKDLIIRGGENLSPREIEDFLRLHENIEDAAVVGAPDEPLGEMVFAFLKMKPGTSITLAELEDWCKGKIATIKIPRACRILEEFPVSATGKVAKGQLRKMAAAAVLQDQAAGK
jgi:fatty-acyl-CoA synthase